MQVAFITSKEQYIEGDIGVTANKMYSISFFPRIDVRDLGRKAEHLGALWWTAAYGGL
jgi:hypothetical protein